MLIYYTIVMISIRLKPTTIQTKEEEKRAQSESQKFCNSVKNIWNF